MTSFDYRAASFGQTVKRTVASMQPYFDRRLFSFCLFQTWIFLVFHSSLVIPIEVTPFSFAYSVAIIFAVAAILFGMIFKYYHKLRVNIMIAGTVLSVLGMVAIRFFPADELVHLLGPALLGTGIGIYIPFIGKLFSSASFEIAVRQTFLSFFFAALLYFLLLGLPWIASVVLGPLLPVLLSAVLLSNRAAGHHAEPTERDVVRELVRSRPIVMFFIGVALLGVAFGFSMSISSLSDSLTFDFANHWSVLIVCVLAFIYFLLLRRAKGPFDFELCFSPVTPIIVIGLMLVSFSTSLSSVLIIAGFQLSDMVVWVVFTWIAGHSGLPQRVFCIGKGSMYAGMLIGSVVALLITSNSQTGAPPIAVAAVVVCLLVIAIVFVFNNSKVTMVIKSSQKNYELTYISQAVDQRCEELGQQFGLTKREKEMLAYLVQGRSLPYIEKAAHISHGTANSHRDHIYSKMNTHSKQELLDIFFDNIPSA